MTRRLLLSYLLVAVLVLAVLEAPLAVLTSRYERGLAASQAERVVTAVAIAAGQDYDQRRDADLRALADHYHRQTGGEVEVIAPDGSVLAAANGDTDTDADADHRYESRLTAAALSGASVSELTSDRSSTEAIAAVPIGDGDGSSRGVALLELPAGATVARIHELWALLAVFAVAVLGLTSLVGLRMARSLSRPLVDLADGVGAVGRGDLAVRVATTAGPAEVRELSVQFNEMAGRLAELVDAQSRFVSDASHQLRSPLTALRLRLENLEATVPADSLDAVTAAGREVQRLSRLVDGLLTLGSADRAAPALAQVDVGEVIDERCGAWSAYADERRVRLLTANPPDVSAPLVPGDLDQVLDNLLANALDASPAGGTIEVAVALDGPRGEIHVVDQGPGMTAEERRRAFDRFWQGAGSNGGHSGLGLAIVRRLAERNGFEVVLQPAVGGGVDAVVRLGVTVLPARRVSGRR